MESTDIHKKTCTHTITDNSVNIQPWHVLDTHPSPFSHITLFVPTHEAEPARSIPVRIPKFGQLLALLIRAEVEGFDEMNPESLSV